MEFSKEQMNKAKLAKSADELLELANKDGIVMTKDQAEKYFKQLNTTELSDDDLDSVAGGKETYYGDYYQGQKVKLIVEVMGGRVAVIGTINSGWEDNGKWCYSITYELWGCSHHTNMYEDQIEAY